MKRTAILSLAVAAALFRAGALHAQVPAPTPTLGAPTGVCPALARFDFDVSSVPGADRTLWQIRRAEPGQGFGAATQVDNGVETATSGTVERDLRAFGPVLDGTRYFFRVRARQGGTNLTAFSEPVVFEPSVSPDGMFTAEATSDGLRIDYALTGDLAACADRVAIEVERGGWGSPPPESDPAADRTVTANGTSGQFDVDVSDLGAGDYGVRLAARFGSNTPDDEVGGWGTPVTVTIPEPLAARVRLRVTVEDVVLAACGVSPLPGVVVRLQGGGLDLTRTTDVANRRAEFLDLPAGVSYALSTTMPCSGDAEDTVTPTTDTDHTFRIEGCHHPTTDVSVTVQSPPTGTGGTPFSLSVGLQTEAGFHSRPGEVVVERIRGTSAPVEIARQAVSPICQGQVRTLTVSDALPLAGASTYRATLALQDADPSNNVNARTVSFTLPPPTVVVAETNFLTIASFRLQNGAASVSTGTPVTLDVVPSGQAPTQYKAAECGTSFDGASFQAWPASPPPTLRGFTTPGSKVVCLQLRGSSALSPVARDTISAVLAPQGLVATTAVTVNSFQLRRGEPEMASSWPVTLGATASGSPTHYRAIRRTSGTCASAIGSASWHPWSAGSPPTIILYLGRQTVCFQLKRAETTAASEVLSSVVQDDIQGIPGWASTSWLGTGSGTHQKITCDMNWDPATGAPRPMLIGLRVAAGSYVHAVTSICATLGANGEHGGVEFGNRKGGSGGTETDLTCPSGEIAYGVKAKYGQFIDQLGVACRAWSADAGAHGSYHWLTATAGGTGGEFSNEILCPNQLGAQDGAVYVHLLGFVSRIQLNCLAQPALFVP